MDLGVQHLNVLVVLSAWIDQLANLLLILNLSLDLLLSVGDLLLCVLLNVEEVIQDVGDLVVLVVFVVVSGHVLLRH